MSNRNATGQGRRRSHGTGSLIVRTDTAGRETFYGQWRADGRIIKRRIGPKRVKGTRQGLTLTMAEAALRQMMAGHPRAGPPAERVNIATAGKAYLTRAETVTGLKLTTITDYRIMLDNHLAPHFRRKALGKITVDDINRYVVAKRRTLAAKTVRNHLNFANALFVLAMSTGWARANPVPLADRPRQDGEGGHDLRFLTRQELEALLRAVPDDDEGSRDRALYATAAWAGLRQGELAALRWRDVDWAAGLIRVRRNFTHGRMSTPKSDRSARAVPMFDRLAGELDRHFTSSSYQGDGELVFCHPHTGSPFDASQVRHRFRAALKAAGVRRVRFHDLRHTFGTSMAAAGCPLRTLQGYLGHASYATTEVYADFAPDTTRGAAWAAQAFGAEAAEEAVPVEEAAA